MKRRLQCLLGAVALVPGLALADASNFNYMEGRYLTGSIGGVDVHGWGIEGNFQLSDRAFLRGTFDRVNLDENIPNFRFDSEGHSFGGGFVFGANPTASLYGTAQYVEIKDRTRVNLNRFTDRYTGYDLGVGARINLTPEAELELAVNHTDLGRDGGDVTVPSGALVYKFTPQFAGVARYSRKSSNDMLGLGFRFYF